MSSRCPCGFSSEARTWSAEWERQHRDHHLAVYPDVGFRTRQNLDDFVRRAEQKECATCGGTRLITLDPPRVLDVGVEFRDDCPACADG